MSYFSDSSYTVQHTSGIELSRGAFVSNVEFVRNLLGPHIQLSAVLKGNAYGHGLEQMTSLCLEAGVKHISVFSAQEAQRIRKHTSSTLTIMIMGMIDSADLPWAIANSIEFFVFEQERLLAAVSAAKQAGKKARIHLEVETGMNRTGFGEDEIEAALSVVKEYPQQLEVVSLCTHFAGAEEMVNQDRIRQQLESYNRQYEQFTQAGLQPPLRQTACSAATLNFPETRMDLVRIGIMLYGFWPNLETKSIYMRNNPGQPDPLRRLISWKSRVMSVKKVRAGEYIGYGTSYQATNDMTIATVPVGYAYGFSRSLSNTGRVLVHGQPVVVVGVVNMNLMMVDVSALEGVKKGDEVVMIGRQGENTISVASFSEMSQQLNYEMLTRLPADIPRNIIE